VVVLCRVVWVAVVGSVGGGVVAVWVTVVAVVCVVTAPVVLLVLDDEDRVVREGLGLSGGTGPTAPGRVTAIRVPVPEAPDASDPAWAGAEAELDFTALPTPKPAAIAITSSAPSTHHRRCMFPSSVHPVPRRILVPPSSG
jgi:hypothetical protein